jgi:hypothetical protein
MTTSEIEKQNLEAHVELCAQRYAQLNSKLDFLSDKVTSMEQTVSNIAITLAESNDKHNRQLITIGTSIIVVLIGAIITLLMNFNKLS